MAMNMNTAHIAATGAGFNGRQAVVIGGSIAGLLAARVLADHFAQVTVIERDALSDSAEPRKGVPQGRQAHGLLAQGEAIMSRLFPGLFAELLQAGSVPVDMGADVHWFQMGGWKTNLQSGITGYGQTRPLLEQKIRARVATLPNVRILDQCEVSSLEASADGSRITGVRIMHRDGSRTGERLSAQLVVDASGRGSHTPQWLKELGYPEVEEAVIKMEVGYTTRIYRQPPGATDDWKVLMIFPKPPVETRAGVLMSIEGGRWILSLSGWHKDHPPTDDEGFLAFARSLSAPDIYNAIKDAEPLTAPVSHKVPSNLRHYYERMTHFPEGLAVLGDALCSFNPTYGQGMTTSALDVMTLDAALREQARRHAGDITGVADRFRKQVAKVIATPWMLATGEDFRYPQTTGERPPGTAFLHWYVGKVHEASTHDRRVTLQFMRVMHMISSPASLFAPPIAIRVLLGPALWGRRTARPADPARQQATGKTATV
jgi:2-polyprenyl-6-methoxyphenol hydroxylase-like FAD-dependent oxidoreductase